MSCSTRGTRVDSAHHELRVAMAAALTWGCKGGEWGSEGEKGKEEGGRRRRRRESMGRGRVGRGGGGGRERGHLSVSQC